MACLGGVASAAPLPSDARLDAERAQLQALVDGAEQEGLPAELLTAKIREGLAKNVPPGRITSALAILTNSLRQARVEASAHVAQRPAALLKAIVDAHALGASNADVALVLAAAAGKPATAATRSIEVLGDLLQRKLPARSVTLAVAQVVAHRPVLLGELAARVESLSRLQGVTPVEALDALARVSALGLSPDQAAQLVHGHDGPGNGPPDGKGPLRETTGDRGPPPDRIPKGRPH